MVRTSSIYTPSMVHGDRGSRAGCRRKSVMFFVCLSVMLWNYKVCDNGNAMKQYYYQNNYGVIACRKVFSCAPIFNFFCGPSKFFIGENLYQKLRFFSIFASVDPHFYVRTMKFNIRARTWDSLQREKFCKNRLKGIPLLGKFIPKNTNFGDFGDVDLHI